jgi:2-polyprenyl-3-methyl-5-hydroxy-6-metoxy-1,4-benzoquinol methylase
VHENALEGLYSNKDQQYYSMERQTLACLIPKGTKKVLDIGCGSGVFGRILKQSERAKEVYGIELNREAASLAEKHLDKVYQANIESWTPEIQSESMDAMIMADVVEHLLDPWKTLKSISSFLQPDGIFIVSIPNVRCWRVTLPLLLKGEWRYAEWGLLDKGHLRFFTRKSATRLLEEAGYSVEETRVDLPLTSISGKINLMTFNIFRDFLSSHIIFRAKKKK